ncbi:MAG: M48 family metallopeptidase [Limisphaerales bacterium]
MHWFALLILVLIGLRTLTQAWLEWLNQRHVEAHADAVPPAFKDTVDPETYRKTVDYTLAKIRFGKIELAWGTLLTIVILYSGILPAIWSRWIQVGGTGSWASAAGLFLVGVLLALPSLPLDAWSQFRLEERFGFNTTTPSTWCLDRLKSLVLAALLGIPLLALLLQWVKWTGDSWWLWAWATFFGFQILMLLLAPVLILPRFNKFTPLPDGALKDRLIGLAQRTRFQARGIEVMDGSKRSRHSNAFFTGMGRFRKIVLFDTLISQLGDEELEAVLAHEIGHFRLRHIPKMFAGSAVMTLLGFAAIGWLARQPWFFQAFGFETPSVPVALLLFALLADVATFWFTPLSHLLSRKFEYQADAFAAEAMGSEQPLIRALRKLSEKNLSNLTPHPAYSGFYYSHPTLLERETALARGAAAGATG